MWETSRGRFIDELLSDTRTPFQRDRDRIIHSLAFRCLKQKTQVFVAHEGDHYRTRLTHSLEVAQIARSLARTLGVDEDLAEALALAHDLGHPPFGHAGEEQLNICMQAFGGFDHNAQALRVVTRLERRYPRFDGLNLTWEMLEGLCKHNGPLIDSGRTVSDLASAFRDFAHLQTLEIDRYAGPEAQIAALADDIAYNNHDIDDGITAGLLTIEDMLDLPLVGDVFRGVMAEYPDLDRRRIVFEAVRRLIGLWVDDVVRETNRRVDLHKPKSSADVRVLPQPLVMFSNQFCQNQKVLRAFLKERMYRHYKVNRMRSQAKRILAELFDHFMTEPETLPDFWRSDAEAAEKTASRARIVCDYLAGMSDSYALNTFRRLRGMDGTL